MKIKNICAYRIKLSDPERNPFTADNKETLEAMLPTLAFNPRAKSQPQSIGWIPPVKSNDEMVIANPNELLITLQIEDAIIPSATVKRAVEDTVVELEHERGAKVHRKERLDIKDQVIAAMLPKALSKHTRIDAVICPANDGGLILVGASSFNKAEILLNHLRATIEGVSFVPLSTHDNPSNSMSLWLADELGYPPGVEYGGKVTLKDWSDTSSSAVIKNLDIGDIKQRILEGLKVTRMSLHQEDLASYTLTDQLQLLSVALNWDNHLVADRDEIDDPVSRTKADLLFFSYAITNIINTLAPNFGGLRSHYPE